ncbi:tail assembly protein [Testudinibacter sp. TR-2022]|uniref:tail assembly protein n=1 Tax=Testudinibacter sp. TR-2022 TaxID=2585029 RepID=UPI001117D955|nr:tail assembly protein [Testudinibacter sp. TR-2022]TNH06618.1 tail assembly protein [Pasteurellaceae bacterium Phil11]TNH25543.1 tail assembly protein [Testudinibacter sp. TR-2022]TNH25677.1 tail assembly protein [Testudinibacter sp. TR-2022]
MLTVKLYGDLKQFIPDDKPLKLAVATGAEAIKCLTSQIEGLQQHIMRGVYKVRIGSRYLSEQNLIQGLHEILSKGAVLHITPVLKGAKRGGVFQTVFGLVLIAAAYFVPAFAPYAMQMYAAGGAMVLGGVSQMLTKPPNMDMKLGNSDKKTGSAFSGLQNLSPQNRPIPLLYGRMMVSMILISQGVDTFIPEPTEAEKEAMRKEEEKKIQQAKSAGNRYPKPFEYGEHNERDREREAENERADRERAEADKKNERDERRSEGTV